MQYDAPDGVSNIHSDPHMPGEIIFKGVLVQFFFTHVVNGTIEVQSAPEQGTRRHITGQHF